MNSLVLLRRSLVAGCFLIVQAQVATAVVRPRHSEELTAAVVAPYGFVATTAPVPLEEIAADLPAATLDRIALFRGEHGGEWRFVADRRSGGMALVEGSGIAWIPGSGNTLSSSSKPAVDDLAARALELVKRYPELFQLRPADLILDRRGSSNFGETGQFWNISFRQVIGGIPVAHSRVVFRISHGNLVQFGADRTLPTLAPEYATLADVRPLLSVASARAALAAHVGGLKASDRFFENGDVQWIARAANGGNALAEPVGRGWQGQLVRRYSFERPGATGYWRALVDAVTGDVASFVDANEYAVLAKGSVYTLNGCADQLDCIPGSVAEVGVTMPFARMDFVGGTCTGAACFTNSAGAYNYPAGAVTSSTSLDGKYFRVADGCGAISAAGAAPGGVDLGTSLPNPPLNTNTDCFAANRQSPPNSGTMSGGAGDTHSARNTYYHLNLIGQKARAYLPGNDWLKGIDGSTASPVIITTNLPPACNAFWSGGVGSLNFMRVTPGLFCNNTGELPDVFLHEFGHGLDQNDGTGTAPEGSTGEAMGDTFALLEGQHSCIGVGFRLKNPANAWGNAAGYGSSTTGSKSRLCSGVRDMDYTRYCNRGAAGNDCVAARDLDAPNGSRSGLVPGPNPDETGTPARWNHMIEGAPLTADGTSNNYDCPIPDPADCVGPLGHECHCESLIPSQANFDLAKRLIAVEFSGSVYAVPQGAVEVSGWQYMDRLWYLTRDIAVSGYSVTGPNPLGTTNGCGVDNWFSTYRLVDDDNGNLADGTPHADIIFSAFDIHAIACGAATDPANQKTGCPAPIAAPVLSTCTEPKVPVQLTWTASPGATQYRVLRNTLGCEYGFQPIAVVPGAQLFFEDAEVAPGVIYNYRVQPVGVNPSCYGVASNCLTVSPTTCTEAAPLPPTGVTVTAPASNTLQVTWNAPLGPITSYKVYRKGGNCASANSYVAIAVVAAPTTSYTDTGAIVGGSTYSYQIVASTAECSSCTSPPSACVSAVASGTCGDVPLFAGVSSVTAGAVGECKLTVSWPDATARCGSSSALTYTVYRSIDSAFFPSSETSVASGLTGTTYIDYEVVGGVRYYYIVRARDSVGNADANTVRRNEVAVGSLTPGTFADDAGDGSVAPQFAPGGGSAGPNTWAIRTSGTNNATRHYATTATGNYQDNSCMGLQSVTVFLGASPSLTFRSRYFTEPGWDGGYVEVATEPGGFTNWTKLSTVNYPGVMTGAGGDPACGGPGFADGQQVFTGVSAGNLWSTHTGSLAAYANQRIRLRFLFSSDGSTNLAGWFIDDIEVTGALLPGPCVSEVSGEASGHPLYVFKRPSDANVDLEFENLGAAVNKYHVYQGTIGNWYSHTQKQCNATTVPGGPGNLRVENIDPTAGNVYFLVSGGNGVRELNLGFDSSGRAIPDAPVPCGP